MLHFSGQAPLVLGRARRRMTPAQWEGLDNSTFHQLQSQQVSMRNKDTNTKYVEESTTDTPSCQTPRTRDEVGMNIPSVLCVHGWNVTNADAPAQSTRTHWMTERVHKSIQQLCYAAYRKRNTAEEVFRFFTEAKVPISQILHYKILLLQVKSSKMSPVYYYIFYH